MLYLSVYQILKAHIEGDTAWGKKLKATRKNKEINLQFNQKDEFDEQLYSAAHFELDMVLDIIAETIQQKRTNQAYVLVEGLCNHHKLVSEEDKLSLRLMDEFFRIEKKLGKVYGVIGLQFESEKEFIDENEVEKHKFPEPEEPVVQEAKPEGEEGEEEAEAPPAEEGEEPKEPTFKPEDYEWTVTDKKPMNLPTLFL